MITFDKFEQGLTEGKQVGIIYHYTMIGNLIKILKDFKLKDLEFNRGYISFTRTGNSLSDKVRWSQARIVIDGNKLSNSYKITSDSQAIAGGKLLKVKSFKNKQAEERIYKKEVDITKSIIQVDIIKGYAEDELSYDEKKFIESKTKLNIIDKFTLYK